MAAAFALRAAGNLDMQYEELRENARMSCSCKHACIERLASLESAARAHDTVTLCCVMCSEECLQLYELCSLHEGEGIRRAEAASLLSKEGECACD